jgi:rhamnosyl/mannosyltransferase
VLSYQSDIVRQKVLLRAYAPLMHVFLRSVDRVVATSPQYHDTSAVLQGLPGTVPVIPNGVDESRFPQPSPERLAHWRERLGPDFFLFVGVLRYYKGLDTLLNAAEGFEGRVVIVGSGPEEAHLRQHAQSHHLENVSFLGTVDEEDKMCLLHLARAFVFPSHLRSEAFGMSLVEAAMCGKPMVSCSIGTGTSFINEDGVTGWTVPPGDEVALRAAMDRLRCDAPLAAHLGAAARRRFEELFTARRMAQAYHELYRSIIPASPTARQPRR